MNNQVVTVNLVPGLSAPAVVRVSQYDYGRPIVFNILDGTQAATIDPSATITVVGTKPSGLGFSETALTISGGAVTLNTTLAMTQESGLIPAEIRIEKQGSGNVGTANFILAVEKTPHAEGTTDGTQESMQNLEARLQSEIDGLDDRIEALEEGQSGGSGLTDNVKTALLQIAQKVAYIDEHGQTYYNALYNALYPPADLVSITAVYTQSGTVYTTASLDDLKSDLTVSAEWSDGSSSIVADTDYTLSGTLTEGTSTVTVNYGGKSTTFDVTVTAPPTLQSITATYTQSGTVYDTDTLDDLKSDLVVTANYSDSTSETVTDYTLSGTLVIGTSTITVSYGEKTASFNVTVTDYNAVDYTVNPLDGITWHDGYTYNQSTGVLTATSGEHCTDKFDGQSCVYIFQNSDTSNNRYFAIFAWDETGTYIGYIQYNASVFSLKKGYKYALKVYNTANFDPTTLSFLPKDNTQTATAEFSIKLADYVDSITVGGNGRAEFKVNTLMTSMGITADNLNTKINNCNISTVLSPVSTSDPFTNREFTFWFYNINTLMFKVSGATTLDAVKTYIANNDPTIIFNKA